MKKTVVVFILFGLYLVFNLIKAEQKFDDRITGFNEAEYFQNIPQFGRPKPMTKNVAVEPRGSDGERQYFPYHNIPQFGRSRPKMIEEVEHRAAPLEPNGRFRRPMYDDDRQYGRQYGRQHGRRSEMEQNQVLFFKNPNPKNSKLSKIIKQIIE